MKIAVIGSRTLDIPDLKKYIPPHTTEIVTGGARGIDMAAAAYAKSAGLALTVFRPDYKRYKKGAPLKRNIQIIEYADEVVAMWDGKPRGTKNVIDECRARDKKVTVFIVGEE